MELINAKIFDGEKMIEKGYVRFAGEKITDVGEMKAYKADGGEVLDLTGKTVFPGLIDAHSHLGMWNDSVGFEGDDGNEDTDPLTPQLLGSDGVKIFDRCFGEALSGGVTTVVTGPGSANPAGGFFAAFQTGGDYKKRLYKDRVGLKIAFGENPKTCYKGKDRGPVTRMATAAYIRDLLNKTKRYMADCERAKKDSDFDAPDYDAKLEAASLLLSGKIPAFAHAHIAEDIMTAVRISKEFGFRLVVVHGTGGAKIADYLAAEKVPVFVGPILSDRCKPELSELSPATAGILDRAGVKIALINDHPVIPQQYLLLSAAVSVKEGLPRLSAYKAVTSNPAELCGLAKKGRLKKGFDADIAVFDGDPLDVFTNCESAYIMGEKVR